MVDFARDDQGKPLPELFRGPEAAVVLNLSRATFYRYDARGLIPRAVRIGKCRRWRRDELRRWSDAGCPSRERWEEMNR